LVAEPFWSLPPVGGGDPAGDARFGFGVRGGNFGFNLVGAAGSGYSSSTNSVTPSITLPNGGTGSIFSGQQRPFVTGLVPVVGHFSPGVGFRYMPPVRTSPLIERIARMQDELAEVSAKSAARDAQPAAPASSPTRAVSSAERGDLSLSAIRAQADAAAEEESAEVAALIEAGRLREEAGQPGQALIDYSRAAAIAQGEQKRELQKHILLLREQVKQKRK
jgi:hypothetical protein